jgi:hypothetical protein
MSPSYGGLQRRPPLRGKKCFGVSVFDFRLPRPESKSRFIGNARIPGFYAEAE